MRSEQGGDYSRRQRGGDVGAAEPSSSSRDSDAENEAAAANATELKRKNYKRGDSGHDAKKRARRMDTKSGVKTSVKLSGTKMAGAMARSPNGVDIADTPRQRPTNNQLLYRINFNWEHYEHALPASVRKTLPRCTEACASVTSAFLQTLKALDTAESQRTKNPRNILQLLSVNTRRTKVVALNAGTHRVPDELRRHQLTDSDGNEYSTNLDRNRYGSDNNYLYTVTRFNLQALELCPLMAQVQIIGTKGSADDVLLGADKSECSCGGNRKMLSNHWTVPAFVLPSQMPTTIPKSTLAAKDRSRKKSRQSMSSDSFRPERTPDREMSTEDQHTGMGVLLDALTSVGGIPASPAPKSRARPVAPVMSPVRPVRGIRQVELDLGAINPDTLAAQEQIVQATAHSINQIPDENLRKELHSAIARSCELHMTASAAQMAQRKAEREAEEQKLLVHRLEELLEKSEAASQQAQIQISKTTDDSIYGPIASNENDRVIQGSALLAHKLIAMQQNVATIAARCELMLDQTAPRSTVEELLRTEMRAHLQTTRALLRAETSLAAYAAAEATCDEEIWRTQYVQAAQRNLEQAAYQAQNSTAAETRAVSTPAGDQVLIPPPAPVLAASQPAAGPEPLMKISADTPMTTMKAPRSVKSIAIMADANATANMDGLPPKTPIGGSARPKRLAFVSPP